MLIFACLSSILIMNQTIRQICSDIINDVKAYNLDDRLSYRFIKNKLFDKISIFVKQDAEMRKLQKLSDLWKPLTCFPMIEIPIDECGDNSCDKILKSTYKVPSVYQTSYGYSLRVFNNNYSKEFLPIAPGTYRDIKGRPFKSKNGYYWLANGYLMIPDSTIEEVTLSGMFKEDSELAKIKNPKACIKLLDSVFSFPDYLIALAKKEVLTELLGGNRRVQEDDKPNDNHKD